MKKLLFSLCVYMTMGAASASDSGIDENVRQYAEKTTIFLHERDSRISDSPFSYVLSEKRLIDADVNNDGIIDKVAELYFCEEHSCHVTTGMTDIVLFKGTETGFQFVDAREFDLHAEVKSVSKTGLIRIVQTIYGEADPSCCPSVEEDRIYRVTNGVLIEIR